MTANPRLGYFQASIISIIIFGLEITWSAKRQLKIREAGATVSLISDFSLTINFS